MTTIHWLQTVLEISLALLIIYAYIRQDKLIAWEQRQRKRFNLWQRRLRRSVIAWGDVYFGEPCLIKDGQKEPLRILTAREEKSHETHR